jgi:HD-like signal output (HDOD) protein
MVNSSFFGQATKIDTVDRAVNLLGTRQIHDLALATSVTEVFGGISNQVFNMEKYWHASVRCGVTSRLIAYQCNILDSERLFVSGLLQDIGHLIMYTMLADEMIAILQQAEIKDKTLSYLEKESLGFDYAEVGAEMMSAWNFPESLIEVTRYHLEPNKAKLFPMETAIVNIAKNIDSVMAQGQALEQALKAIHPDALRLTGLSVEALESICTESTQKTTQAIDLIFPHSIKAS